MRLVMVTKRALVWGLLALVCLALVGYALSGPPATTTGVAVYHRPEPATPHESGISGPPPEPSNATDLTQPAPARATAIDTALERERNRAQRLEVLRTLAAEPGTSSLTRDEAQRRLLDELDRAAKEEELLEVLEAEGFDDSLVVLTTRGLTISIHGRRLDPATAARLGELASRMTGLPPERIVLTDGR